MIGILFLLWCQMHANVMGEQKTGQSETGWRDVHSKWNEDMLKHKCFIDGKYKM